MELAELSQRIDDDRLQLFVFGPGTGEGLALRVPRCGWLIVDSCSGIGPASGLVPALALVEAAGDPVQAVVLTHPHTDHAVGIDLLIERFDPRWVGCVEHFLDDEVESTANSGHWYRCRKSWPARAAIKTFWLAHPERKWDLAAGSKKKFGDAEAQALHPRPIDVDEFADRSAPNPNDLSTPLAITWEDVRLVLGADLPEAYWGEALAIAGWQLSKHHGLKVSHHASEGAQHPKLLERGEQQRCWVATPWQGGTHLPDYADGGSVEQLLGQNPELIVTSLTRSAARLPLPLTRKDLIEALVVKRLGNGLSRKPSRRPEISEAWALVSFAKDGSIDLDTGEEALRLTA